LPEKDEQADPEEASHGCGLERQGAL
jgi:hypothetical protein